MTCTDWTNLILGASLGAIIGFLISEFRLFISNQRNTASLRNFFLKYEGTYSVKTKGGHESKLVEVNIKYF